MVRLFMLAWHHCPCNATPTSLGSFMMITSTSLLRGAVLAAAIPGGAPEAAAGGGMTQHYAGVAVGWGEVGGELHPSCGARHALCKSVGDTLAGL
jgi:hypothetical protein